MVAYIICEKNDSNSKLNDRSAAINIITSNMSRMNDLSLKNNKDSEGIFKMRGIDKTIVYDDGRDVCDHLTICKFLLAVELTAPIDSPEFEKALAGILSPEDKDSAKKSSSADAEDEEDEEE